MDDDVVAPAPWLEKIMQRFDVEPDTTAVISSKVIEPGTPDSFMNSPEVNRERYMCTFRGCGSMARTAVLERAEYYDEKFFIYGNERDLAARILNLGYRILPYPVAEIRHKTPSA
jgi:GT2 family glycosyltransferase